MKKFFFYAFAVMTAVCMAACSSDDDNSNKTNNSVDISAPAYADQAARYTLEKPKAPANADVDAPQLKTIDITESGELLMEFYQSVSKTTVYVKEKAVISGNTYTMNGTKVKGIIKVVEQAARATRSGDTQLTVDVAVKFSALQTYTYTTEDGEIIHVTKGVPPSGDDAMAILARTWNVLGLILDLKGPDVKAFETWESTGGVFDLETTLLKAALEREVSLTDEEQDALKKKVKNVAFTKTKLFCISYTDNTEDVASWDWTDASKTAIRITLKDEKMGNKFIEDASLITFAFNGDRCNMKLVTNFTDSSNKNWDATVTLQLQSPK